MSGVIIKCPKCGRGHMKDVSLSYMSASNVNKLIHPYMRSGLGFGAYILKCSRCGLIVQPRERNVINGD